MGLQKIRVADIDISDTRFRISTGEKDLSSIGASIAEIGLVSPPILWPHNSGFVIVSGFNRVGAVCLDKDVPVIDCLVLHDLKEGQCAIKAVALQAFQSPLTLVETINSLMLLNRFLSVDEISQKSDRILNTKMNQNHIQNLLRLGDQDPLCITLLEQGHLALKPALRILDFEARDRVLFWDLFSRIRASSSKQMEIMTFAREICSRDKIGLETLFTTDPVLGILNNEQKDKGLKANLIRQWLSRLRYPHLEEKRSLVKSHINRLSLGKGIGFDLPRDFEGTTYSLTLDFKTPGEFRQRLDRLTGLRDHPLIPEILDRGTN